MHDPAARRELLWKLHHTFGYGFRRWQARARDTDERVSRVAKAACAGIKVVMKEDGLLVVPIQANVPKLEAVVPVQANVPLQEVVVPVQANVPKLEVPKAIVEQAPGTRMLMVQHSNASICALSCQWPSREESDVETVSCTDTEAWETDVHRSHSRRPRRNRRAKASARRAQWEDVRRSMGGEVSDEQNCLFGALLTCLEEDEDLNGLGLDDPLYMREEFTRAGSSSQEEDGDSQDDDTVVEVAAVEEARSVPSVEDEDGSDDSFGWEEMDTGGLMEQELLEGLDKGVELLPTSLVWTMVRLQEAADKWQAVDDAEDLRLTLVQGVTELRQRCRRVVAETRRLSNAWNCPRFMQRHWDDLQDYLLEGEYGPGCQRKKLDELLEEWSERGEELETEWLEAETVGRCLSLRKGWDEFVRSVEAVEFAKARQTHQEQRRAAEVLSTQEAINERLAISLGCRR